MTIHTYSNATITLNGKAFALADLTMAERRPSINFAQPSTSITFEATMPAPPDLGRLLRDVLPSAPMVDMHLPAGVLGHIALRGFVSGATTRGDAAAGTIVEMGVSVAENALRRALSMAVQRTIVERVRRTMVVVRALLDNAPWIVAHARCVASKRGVRKERRAMRRLLRAAGALYWATTTPSTKSPSVTSGHKNQSSTVVVHSLQTLSLGST